MTVCKYPGLFHGSRFIDSRNGDGSVGSNESHGFGLSIFGYCLQNSMLVETDNLWITEHRSKDNLSVDLCYECISEGDRNMPLLIHTRNPMLDAYRYEPLGGKRIHVHVAESPFSFCSFLSNRSC